MSNFSIKFLSVDISNFRGIPGLLTVPLDAPLTVIYAPNGTGKSTVCYALEWLLTGEIKDVGSDDHACQWGNGVTYVAAKCLINGVPHLLQREGKKFWLTKESAKRARFSEENLLDLLTPAAISGSTPQAIKKAKRGWLRNSRWLYSNSLALLIDNKHAEERQQIFADILGFGHLTDTLRNLKDYKGALPSTKGLHENILRLNTEIEGTQKRLQESAPGRAKAIINLKALKERFAFNSTEENFISDFREAKLHVRLLDQRTEARFQGLAEVQAQWDYYHLSLKKIDSLRRSIATISNEVAELAEKQKIDSDHLAFVNIKYGDGERSVAWANRQLDTLKNVRAIINFPSVAEYFKVRPVNYDSLRASFVEFGWPKEKRASWSDALLYLENNLAEITSLVQEQLQLEANVVLPAVNLQAAITADRLAQDNLIRQTARFDALADTSERLKSLGCELLNANDTHVCPLCTHKWDDAQLLRKNIFAKAVSPVVQEASQTLDAARVHAQATAKELAAAKSVQTAHDQYNRQLNQVKEKLSIFENKSSYIATLRDRNFSSLNIQQIEYLKERVKAAFDLDAVFAEFPELQRLFPSALDDDFVARVEEFIVHIGKYFDYYKKQMDEFSPQRGPLEQSVKALAAAIDQKSSQIKSIAGSVSALSIAVDRFSTLWADVASDLPITLESRLAVVTEMEIERKRIAGYKLLLDECEVVASLDEDASALEKLDVELKQYQEKLKVGSKYIIEADSAIEKYEQHVKDLTSSSLDVLLGPATELFSRMHANEVYKGLGVSENKNYFQWTAFAEGHDEGLDAESKFSQGQRQDLALSLYLARARNTGGSFFLDEPIAHLDDLNRVAMLDIFRLVATSMPSLNLVLTTASESLARHMAQKFSSITDKHLLNMVRLDGNPRTGVNISVQSNLLT